jgi:hypothetical protein
VNAVAVAILTDARKRVEAGWIQRRAYNEAGDVCAGHAIDLAYQNLARKMGASQMGASQDDRFDAVGLLSLAIEQATHRRWTGGIPDWNDHDSRTKDEVLAAFDEAIRLGQRHLAPPKKVEAIWSPVYPASITYNLIPATVESISIETYEKVMETAGV